MELFYFKQQTKTPSPSKLATATSIAKKTYNESFLKVNCQIHPSDGLYSWMILPTYEKSW